MQNLTLTRIFRTFKDRNGNQLITRDGRNYEKVAIKAREYEDQWLSGFGGEWNRNWKEGDIVKVLVEQKGQYLNFSKVNETDEIKSRLEKLEAKVNGIIRHIETNEGEKPPQNDYPENDPDEIPF